MASAFLSRILLRQKAIGPLTRSVLLIALLATLPGARADVVPDWNRTTAQALRAAKAGTGLAQSRVHAMVHGAMFDAVNAIERRYHSYAVDLEAVPGASQDAAAAAAHAVLAALYPLQQATLDAALAASLAKLQDGPAKADGVALGKAAAEKMLALRRNDRMDDKVLFAPKAGPGAWQLAANTDPVGLQHPIVLSFAGTAQTTLGRARFTQSHCEDQAHTSFRRGIQTITFDDGWQLFGAYHGHLLATPTTGVDARLIISGHAAPTSIVAKWAAGSLTTRWRIACGRSRSSTRNATQVVEVGPS